MILPFEKVNDLSAVGNKAKSLILLKKEGFNVPDGFIADCSFYKETIKSNGIDVEIKRILKTADISNIDAVSEEICLMFDKLTFDSESKEKFDSMTSENVLYAVRSSADKEDLERFSFAGQYDTFLNVEKKDLCESIIKCYKSLFSPRALSYILENGIAVEDISMCVIVQQMVESDYSGVCFTVDPLSGKDTLMLIETSEGIGDNIVSGKTSPKQFYYDWYSDELQCSEKSGEAQIKTAAQEFLKVQLFFGYPCDIEFAVKGKELYILQSRMITRISHASLDRMWTTADFKDGISASCCKMMMWSLYEYAFENSLRSFYLKLGMLKPKDIDPKLSDMFYARCYWNLSSVKKAMQTVVGFNEQDFENDYGISSSSDGQKHRQSLLHSLRVYLGYRKEMKNREKNNKSIAEKLLDDLDKYKKKIDNGSVNDIKKEWYTLTRDAFLKSESNYFSFIFLNTVHRAATGKRISSFVSESEKLKLYSNMENVSHLRPFYELWELSRKIRINPDLLTLFENNSPSELIRLLEIGDKEIYGDFRSIVDKYGYHSESELDLTSERFSEKPELLMKTLRSTVMLDDSYSPERDRKKNEKERNALFDAVKERMSAGKFRRFCADVEKERFTLWWREEFRDVSTRYYSVIRAYTLQLSNILLSEGAINSEDDVWFLKIKDIWDYLDFEISAEQLSEKALKNRTYYNAFKNYTSENEIGALKKKESYPTGQLKGICANGGKVTGTARVIESIEDIDRICENDILVTKNTDTGWTPKFAILSGIVTEYGGALCHSAIVSREYNIPAIVSCEGAMQKIKDGQTITVDGDKAVVITED